MSTNQFLRKASLLVSNGVTALDLSDVQFSFHTAQQDVESPNNCMIRVFNLSAQTTQLVRKEFDTVILQAGYESSFGVIFQGNIKQFRMGRVNAVDTYLDILAADGDEAYNFAVVKQTLAAASTPEQRFAAVMGSMASHGVTQGYVMPFTGGVLPRGKVLFGMARAEMRKIAASQRATWSIDNGQLHMIPLTGYKPSEAVVLTAQTGLIGMPEQTQDGVRVRCLLNPRVDVGALIQLDNTTVNRLVQQNPDNAPIAYNQYTGIQFLASPDADGLYRVYVAEHQGDTRGPDWYTDIICLAVNPVTKEVAAYG